MATGSASFDEALYKSVFRILFVLVSGAANNVGTATLLWGLLSAVKDNKIKMRVPKFGGTQSW